MRLFLDVGNTAVKWRTDRNGLGVCDHGEHGMTACVERITQALGEAPEAVTGVSVAGRAATEALRAGLRAAWGDGLPVRFMRARAKSCGVTNGYASPARLGADRWAALVGARELTGNPACVIDCGTAVTVDYLDGKGRHHGGLIMPGLAMSRRALEQGTAGIRAEGERPAGLLARDTGSAVNGGTLFMLVAALDRLVGEIRAEAGDALEVLVTGGDAEALAPLLGTPARVMPDLVLRGVKRMVDSG